jgi:hypothetical protein
VSITNPKRYNCVTTALWGRVNIQGSGQRRQDSLQLQNPTQLLSVTWQSHLHNHDLPRGSFSLFASFKNKELLRFLVCLTNLYQLSSRTGGEQLHSLYSYRGCRTLFEKLTVIQLVKKYSFFM